MFTYFLGYKCKKAAILTLRFATDHGAIIYTHVY